jgi:aconitate hydratase/homoaconitate hydratase
MERTVEYRGEHVRSWSTDVRFTIANMTAEFGGLNGIFEADEVVADWIARPPGDGIREGARYFRADDDAGYVSRHAVDLSRLGPLIAVPFSPDNVVPVEKEAGRFLHGVFIGACTTTEEELVLGRWCSRRRCRGDRPTESPQPAGRARRLCDPAQSARGGAVGDLRARRVHRRSAGCSMCLGIASRKAGRDEVWLSSQNRNYKNRMGEGRLPYLASAATVAASALGYDGDGSAEVSRRRGPGAVRAGAGAGGAAVPEVRVVEPRAVGQGYGSGTGTGTSRTRTRTARVRGRRGVVQRFGDHVRYGRDHPRASSAI